MRIFGLVGCMLMLVVVMWILVQGVNSFQSETMGEDGSYESVMDSAKDAANSMERR